MSINNVMEIVFEYLLRYPVTIGKEVRLKDLDNYRECIM